MFKTGALKQVSEIAREQRAAELADPTRKVSRWHKLAGVMAIVEAISLMFRIF